MAATSRVMFPDQATVLADAKGAFCLGKESSENAGAPRLISSYDPQMVHLGGQMPSRQIRNPTVSRIVSDSGFDLWFRRFR
jgi:hypothetical protein